MPSHLFAEHSAQPPEPGSVDALIARTHLLRGEVDAVRRDAGEADGDDARARWQRALCDLAVHQLDDVRGHLGRLREGLPPEGIACPEGCAGCDAAELAAGADRAPALDSPTALVGTAEWNLLTDEADWSEETHELFGRSRAAGALPLDELGSALFSEDRPLMTAMMTACLIDGRPIDGEFRVVRPDGLVRSLHMRGEPVLDADGCTASVWAVFRDVSDLRRSERAERVTAEDLRRREENARTEQRLAAQLREAVLPTVHVPEPTPDTGSAALDIAGLRLPAAGAGTRGDSWSDAQALDDGRTLLTLGDLAGHGVATTSTIAMLLGALRGMAMAGVEPGSLLGLSGRLLDSSAQPALGSALCCRHDPADSTLTWARAAHPAPVLIRDGAARPLTGPAGIPLGAAPEVPYEQRTLRLLPGDLVVLHTESLAGPGPDADPHAPQGVTERLLALAPELAATTGAREAARVIADAFGSAARETDACVLTLRVPGAR
ncbi:PP2C family protein-serine/threonine phosphatase [Streptomyces sp. BI20]|uniref:PP2C family protein-serine/threonine phosphatase n=1 Tax=Streptomyces sp. BI20 TaxID=3403460 RepID=UPI003C77DA26